MKRSLAAAPALLLALALALTLCSCAGKTETSAAETAPSSSSAPSSSAGSVYNSATCIAETSLLEGDYTDSLGNACSYSFRVPHLLSGSGDAADINSEIDDVFTAKVREAETAMGENRTLIYFKVEWKAFWHGSTLCLVVDSNEEGDWTEYREYNFDFATGKRVTNTELLAMAGLDGDTFLADTKAALNALVEKMYGEQREALGEEQYGQLVSDTVNDKNVNLNMMTYLTEDGSVVVIAPVASVAGAAWYYHEVTVFPAG